MSLKYADVVFQGAGQTDYVWCEYRARLHTLVQVRYQIEAFIADEEYIPGTGRVFRRRDRLCGSSWKKTPKESRDQVSNELGAELKKENIVWEDTFSISIPIIDEKF
jgi:hypothetical protein